jgi:hypothetical protein
MFYRESRRSPHCDDDIDLKADELGRDFGEAFGVSFRRAILNRNGSPRNPTEFAQPPLESWGKPGRT